MQRIIPGISFQLIRIISSFLVAMLIRYKRAMIKLFVHLCVKDYYHSFKPSYSTHVMFIDMDEINISDYRDITINAWLKPRTYLFRLFPEVSAEETSMALSFG